MKRTKRDVDGRDTYQKSLDLFRSGLSISEIARERSIGISTVEGHLARFIPAGKIRLDELVPVEKIDTIQKAVLKFNESGALSPVKEYLGDDYTYGEIRAVMATMAGKA